MQMIGEVNHSRFKFLAGGEQFVFASGHLGDRLGDVLSHSLRGEVGEVEEIYSFVHFVLVVSSSGIENVGKAWREGECVLERIGLRDGTYGVLGLRGLPWSWVSLISSKTRRRSSGSFRSRPTE